MAAGRTIPVDEVVSEACTILKRVTEQEKIFMRQWAYTALRKIGLTKINIQVSDRIYLDDWSAKKPDNLIRTNDIALYNSSGNEVMTKFKGYGSGNITVGEQVSSRIHQDIRSSTSNTSYIAITESDNYFNVESFNDDDEEDIFLLVRYYAIPIDSDGLPKIPEHCTLAIIMYIRAMWAMRENSNQSHIQLAWQMWKEERASAESKGKTPDMIEGKAIAETLNSMIQKTTINNLRF